jgi:signal transduction histidine kinase
MTNGPSTFINRDARAMSARFSGINANMKIRGFSKMLEEQNQELKAQRSELLSQSTELIQQNTVLEEQKRQLNEASQLKTTFLSNMSHETANAAQFQLLRLQVCLSADYLRRYLKKKKATLKWSSAMEKAC